MEASTNWKEQISDGEEARFERYAEALRALQREHAGASGPSRALHAKGVAGVEAEFEVLDGLPAAAQAGLFAKPGRYRAYARFSNGSGTRQPDKTADVRGIAIKVVGVEGRKVIPGLEDAKTQDFSLIRTPVTPFRNADEFMGVVLAAAGSKVLLLPRIFGALGLRTFGVLGRLSSGTSAPIASLATTRYFSAVPIRCGDYAVHYALEPQLSPEAVKQTRSDLGAELASRLERGPVVYDFRLQFYVDDVKTPIEDASVEWQAADAPFVTVARLTLPKQEPASTPGQRLAAYIEELSFDPWHALEAHRPLGNVMRARNVAYRFSTQERKAAPEPDGSERFD